MIENKTIPVEATRNMCDAREITLKGVDSVSYLYVPPRATMKRSPLENEWEVLIRLSHKEAHVCFKSEEVSIENEDGYMLQLLVLRGNTKATYEDFCELFKNFGWTVHHGALIVKDTSISL